MRRALCVLAVVAAVSAWASEGRAQNGTGTGDGGFSDPFFLYYGWYLPRQAAIANQPQVQDSIDAAVVARQSYATTNRSSLYDPNGGYGRFDPNSSYDPFDPASGPRPGPGRPGAMGKMRASVPTSNAHGDGPPIYFNRAAQYYPNLRVGHGPNKNVAVPGRGVRRGGMGVPSASSGLGPR